MNSTEALRNYKHDIVGKFRDIQTVVNDFSENTFEDPESIELLLAVHETLLKMINTSKEVIESQTKKEIVLKVAHSNIADEMPSLVLSGINIRCGLNEYWYYLDENSGQDVEYVKKILPIHKVVYVE